MPLTMCQGLVIGLDKESRTPVLPTIGGVLTDVDYTQTYIESKNINDINYISEGFLSHYKYKYEREKDSTGKKILKGLAVVAILAATVALTIVTMGAGGVVAGVVGAAVISSSMMTAALVATATITVAAAIVTTAAIGTAAIVQRVRSERATEEIQTIKGRIDEIPKGVERVEQEESRQLINDIAKRYLIKDPDHVVSEAVIVPDYQVN
jgi:membrane protein implicated in regulation of membrane protease activity